ncbi:MAG: hypothetical protein ACRC4N_06215 [Gammaproteobacteria bacterium]
MCLSVCVCVCVPLFFCHQLKLNVGSCLNLSFIFYKHINHQMFQSTI